MANFSGTLTGVNFFNGWSWSGWNGANWGSTNQKEIYSYGYPLNSEQHYPVYRVEFDPQGYECTSITFAFHATMTRSDGRAGSVFFQWFETDPTSGSGTVIASTSRMIPVGSSSVTDELTVNFNAGKTFSSRKTLYLKVYVPGSGTSSNPGTINGTVYINSASVHSDFEPSALTPIIQTPKGGSFQGMDPIEFRWTSQGDGTQTQAEIEIDDSSGSYFTWATLGTETDWTSSGNTLEPGSRRWRIRLTNSFNVVSDWVYGSFSVSYPDVNITPTAPLSGTAYGGDDIKFTWEFSGDGSVWQVQMQLSYDNGASWEDVKLRSYDSYTAPALSLPEGRILWRIRSIAAWHDWTSWKQSGFAVTYNAVSTVFVTEGPTSGAYNAQTPITFAAELRASGPVRDPFTVASATLYWKGVNDAEFASEEMTPDNDKATVTIEAGTFPQGTVVWYISATDNTGNSSETEHYSFTAVLSEVDATPTAPINTIQHGSQTIGFSWNYASLDGTAQSRAELQYSTDGETWATFATVTGANPHVMVKPDTFPGATIFWRVRAYNAGGTAGMWSNPVSFTCYAPPIVSNVACDGKPFATITWDAAGQETFELEAGGQSYGPYNDRDARSFVLPRPLTDGKQLIRVRAQNKYSLWSQWASVEVTVQNVPGPEVTLTAQGESSVTLLMDGTYVNRIIKQPQDVQTTDPTLAKITVTFSTLPYSQTDYTVEEKKQDATEWETVGFGLVEQPAENEATVDYQIVNPEEHNGSLFRFAIGTLHIYSRAALFTYAEPFEQSPEIYDVGNYGFYLIFRDGAAIGKTYSISFTDRFALGRHEYYVLQVLPGGYYTKSNEINTEASVDCPMIETLEKSINRYGELLPVTLELRLSESDDREIQVTESQEVVYTQYAGAEYPSAEIGEARSKSVSLDVSALMSDESFAASFKALLGKDVIVKTPGGEVVVGPLPGYNRSDRSSHRAWTFTITQSDWRDFVDES